MKKKSNNKLLPVLIMGALAVGNIAFVQSNVWNVTAGTLIDISSWNADAYQVESVSQLKDGSYLVTSKATGFQSDLEVAVTFDETGTVIKEVQILSQGETDGIGTKVMEDSFLSQFQETAAPVGLIGKPVAVVSPETGAVWGASEGAGEVLAEEKKENLSNPESWNPSDQSPEAVATRKLYRSGLLASAAAKQPLSTAVVDGTPEEQAMYRLEETGLTVSGNVSAAAKDQSPEGQAKDALYGADLLTSAKEGEPMASAPADRSPEEQADAKLQEAGLTVAKEAEEQPAAVAAEGSLNEVDAVAGATVSSTAVVHAIDHAYFFMQEKVLQ